MNADLGDVTGHELIGSDGPIGRIERVYRDDDTQRLEWAVVGARFVPLAEAIVSGEAVRVPYSRAQVEQSPQVPDTGHVYRGQEADLYLHYGLDYDVTSLVAHQTRGPHGDAAGQPAAIDTVVAGAEGGFDADQEVRPRHAETGFDTGAGGTAGTHSAAGSDTVDERPS